MAKINTISFSDKRGNFNLEKRYTNNGNNDSCYTANISSYNNCCCVCSCYYKLDKNNNLISNNYVENSCDYIGINPVYYVSNGLIDFTDSVCNYIKSSIYVEDVQDDADRCSTNSSDVGSYFVGIAESIGASTLSSFSGICSVVNDIMSLVNSAQGCTNCLTLANETLKLDDIKSKNYKNIHTSLVRNKTFNNTSNGYSVNNELPRYSGDMKCSTTVVGTSSIDTSSISSTVVSSLKSFGSSLLQSSDLAGIVSDVTSIVSDFTSTDSDSSETWGITSEENACLIALTTDNMYTERSIYAIKPKNNLYKNAINHFNGNSSIFCGGMNEKSAKKRFESAFIRNDRCNGCCCYCAYENISKVISKQSYMYVGNTCYTGEQNWANAFVNLNSLKNYKNDTFLGTLCSYSDIASSYITKLRHKTESQRFIGTLYVKPYYNYSNDDSFKEYLIPLEFNANIVEGSATANYSAKTSLQRNISFRSYINSESPTLSIETCYLALAPDDFDASNLTDYQRKIFKSQNLLNLWEYYWTPSRIKELEYKYRSLVLSTCKTICDKNYLVKPPLVELYLGSGSDDILCSSTAPKFMNDFFAYPNSSTCYNLTSNALGEASEHKKYVVTSVSISDFNENYGLTYGIDYSTCKVINSETCCEEDYTGNNFSYCNDSGCGNPAETYIKSSCYTCCDDNGCSCIGKGAYSAKRLGFKVKLDLAEVTKNITDVIPDYMYYYNQFTCLNDSNNSSYSTTQTLYSSYVSYETISNCIQSLESAQRTNISNFVCWYEAFDCMFHKNGGYYDSKTLENVNTLMNCIYTDLQSSSSGCSTVNNYYNNTHLRYIIKAEGCGTTYNCYSSCSNYNMLGTTYFICPSNCYSITCSNFSCCEYSCLEDIESYGCEKRADMASYFVSLYNCYTAALANRCIYEQIVNSVNKSSIAGITSLSAGNYDTSYFSNSTNYDSVCVTFNKCGWGISSEISSECNPISTFLMVKGALQNSSNYLFFDSNDNKIVIFTQLNDETDSKSNISYYNAGYMTSDISCCFYAAIKEIAEAINCVYIPFSRNSSAMNTKNFYNCLGEYYCVYKSYSNCLCSASLENAYSCFNSYISSCQEYATSYQIQYVDNDKSLNKLDSTELNNKNTDCNNYEVFRCSLETLSNCVTETSSCLCSLYSQLEEQEKLWSDD